MKGKNKQINCEDREFQINGDIFKEKRKVTTFSNNLKSEYSNATTIIEHIRSIKGDLIWKKRSFVFVFGNLTHNFAFHLWQWKQKHGFRLSRFSRQTRPTPPNYWILPKRPYQRCNNSWDQYDWKRSQWIWRGLGRSGHARLLES